MELFREVRGSNKTGGKPRVTARTRKNPEGSESARTNSALIISEAHTCFCVNRYYFSPYPQFHRRLHNYCTSMMTPEKPSDDAKDPELGKVLDRSVSSELDTHTDPFAQREGRNLVWKNVNMTLVRNKSSVHEYGSLPASCFHSLHRRVPQRPIRNASSSMTFGARFPSSKLLRSWDLRELERPVSSIFWPDALAVTDASQ